MMCQRSLLLLKNILTAQDSFFCYIYLHIFKLIFLKTNNFEIRHLIFPSANITGSAFLIKRKKSLMKILIKTAPSILWLSSCFLQFSVTLIEAITYRNITCQD